MPKLSELLAQQPSPSAAPPAAAPARLKLSDLAPSASPVVANAAHPEDVPYASGANPYTSADLMPAAMAPARPRTLADEASDFGRSAVLAGRSVVKGVASVPDMFIAPAAALVNKGLDAAGVDPAYHQATLNDVLDRGWQEANLPMPANPTERIVDRIEQGLGGVVGGNVAGAALRGTTNQVARGVGETIAANPVVQVVGAGTSGLASGAAHEAGASPVGEIAAGLAGAFVPAIPAGFLEAGRRALRGGEDGRRAVEQALTDFGSVGTSPTVGQATGSKANQFLESTLGRTPGASGVMARRAEAQAGEIQQGVEGIASRLSPNADPARAGIAIERGITGQGGFVDRFKQNANSLYDQLDQYLPQTARVPVENTRAALAELTSAIPGAPQTSRFFRNGKIADIANAVDADTVGPMAPLNRPDVVSEVQRRQFAAADQNASIDRTNAIRESLGLKPRAGIDPNAEIPQLLDAATDGRLPYAAVKKLRTLVGEELANPSLASDVKSSAWDKLYQGLSADLQGAAKQAGPEAERAWGRANTYYRAGQQRIQALDRVVDKAGGPEAVFNAATSGTKDGAFTIRNVMQSLEPDQQKVLSATVLRRLGAATPGTATEQGEFSINSFLTNWNKLSPQAKNTLFDRYGSGFREDVDAISRTAGNFRQSSRTGANTSGTGQAMANNAALTGFTVAALTGRVGAAAGIAGAAGTANLAARAMTSPAVVRFLARSTDIPRSQWPAAIAGLERDANDKGDQTAAEVAATLRQHLSDADRQNYKGYKAN
ncbi:MAG: hypothetical protein AAGC76_09390 [Luteibacter sp.]|uniref:hypothetical protein n=1 Tax=Luteibacter sp. TaxID=1886636 RepID=UPI0028081E5A|nr:hypothetical protein [Luteibacter sp.]MDQ7996055.1 hypothetical protein [Luteibacter sp.]